jgi:hypothetical protein
MNEQDEPVAHPDNSINTSKSRRIQAKLAIRHGQVLDGKPEAHPVSGMSRQIFPL